MYCPRCGEQQVSGNLRFCNKCGLPMDLVSEVTANGGTLPQLEAELGKKKWLTRKNGVLFTIVWLIFFVPFGASFWGILDLSELAAISAVFGVFSSMILMMISLFFLGDASSTSNHHNSIGGVQNVPTDVVAAQPGDQTALPPQQTQPAQDFVVPAAGSWKAPETGELVQSGSVTEGTTKLLQKEESE